MHPQMMRHCIDLKLITIPINHHLLVKQVEIDILAEHFQNDCRFWIQHCLCFVYFAIAYLFMLCYVG
ncbi:hypothetical protein T07_13749 [Trichinella nelsoni]|uniref:Uncharacterized protein n=1 Tax=Trichinella nelsoni TaxID=6336 RepID=A0A0V0RNT9_9BILA|nr:hypothetical protein T07_13749 [Trichinella nelsoni]